MSITTYICTLSKDIQDSIHAALTDQGLQHDDIALAMNSRLCDLTDTININKYL